MKNFIILILFIFMAMPSNAEDVIYLNKKWDKEASRLLYEFELKELSLTPQKAKELFNFTGDDVRAVFYDLNSDGVSEIIGYINVSAFWSSDGMALIILKKENGNYKNISWLNTAPSMGIYVLDAKTSGFKNLKVFPTKNYVTRIAKYNQKQQCYEYFFLN